MITPSLGRIVHYKLGALDATAINRRREHAGAHMEEHRAASSGVQVHVGNDVKAGDVFPMIITKIWDPEAHPTSLVNGQVMLDGNDLYWATSVRCGEGEREFTWPMRNG